MSIGTAESNMQPWEKPKVKIYPTKPEWLDAEAETQNLMHNI